MFQYVLNHKNIVKDPQRKSKFKKFTDKHNWKDTSFPPHKNDWKKFKSNNKMIPPNVLYLQ